MIFKPWDCAQPDEWLPQSLRLCWGGDSSGDGGGGATTGGGDWGSSGSYDASGFDAGGIGAWGGTAYDASVFGSGAGGGGDWGSFGDTSYSGFNAPNPTFADVAGPNAGVTTGGGDWGSAGTFSAAGTGGGPAGAMFGADTYGGGGGGGGFWGSTGGGGDYGGGGGSYGGGGGTYGGGGQQGGGSFGSFGSGTLGGSNAYAAAPTGPTGSAFADSYGGGSVAGPAGQASSGAPTTSEAQSDSADTSEGEAAPTDDAAPEVSSTIAGGRETDFGAPAQSEAAPDDEPAQQDSFASRFDAVAPAQQDTFASRFDAATPDAEQSAFGPQSLDQQSAGEQGKAGQQTAAPDFNQAFEAFAAQPGWNPAEQTAGRTGLAEPTDWAANPYQPSTDVSVGRDFNQAFDPFGDTPTGMDLAGDQRSEAEPSLTFNEMWGTTPYGTLPNDPLSRSAQETLESDFNYFPNPGYVQGPPEATLNDQINAIVSPALNAAMYPFAQAPTAWSNFAQNALLGGSNIQSLNADAFNAFEAGQQGRAGANPDTTDWGSVFEGAAPTEAQPAIEAFIPGGRETNFDPTAAEILAAQQPAPIDVEVVPSTDPSVPADPRADPAAPPATLPPAVPTDESGRPTTETPESGRPAEQQPVAPPPQTPQTPQTPPQEARPAPPGLVDMLPPPTMTPQTQPPSVPPSETRPAETPAEPGRPAEHDDAPEPQDTSQPPQDPNAPRPPENIPGQITGSRGTYTNDRMDNPQTNRNYRDSGRTDYPQGRPGITFRTARQAGVEPLFRTEDINVRDVDARLVENINRALRDMEQRTGIPANSLVATSGWRPAHRGEAHEHGQDPRTSQESVYTRYNPNGRNIGPAAQPGHSNHGPGRALDFAASRARDWLRQHAGEYGLETLGTRRGVPFDAPHIQLQRGQGGQRPSEQEQAGQRALDTQNRQLAQDRGLLAPGRGQVARPAAPPGGWRGIGGDAARDARLAAPPQPPAEVPVARPAPTMPLAPDRPPADIPTLAPRGPNEFDIPVTPAVRNATVIANNIFRQATAHLNTNSGKADFEAASVVAAKAMAAAGVPLATAGSVLTKGAYEGATKAGYGPTTMGWNTLYKPTLDAGIAAALQGYQPAKPGELRGPPAPAAPGRQGAAPFGQQFADLSQSLGSVAPSGMTGRPGEIGAQQPMFSIPGLDRLSPIIAPPVPPAPALPGIMLAGFSPGGQPADAPAASEEGGPTPPAPPAGLLDPNTVDTRGIPSTLGLPTQPDAFRKAYEAIYGGRWLAKGGHVAKDEPVVVGEEGPETFVPDTAGTVVPHMPQPGKGKNVDRWPKMPAVLYPGRYGGVEREIERQTREAQNPVQSLIDLVDSGRLPLNAANWHAMMNDPGLIALGRSRMDDRREGINPGAEQYGTEQPGPVLPVGTYIPTPAPAADPTNPMAQALGYGSIKRRPMQIGRQAY